MNLHENGELAVFNVYTKNAEFEETLKNKTKPNPTHTHTHTHTFPLFERECKNLVLKNAFTQI